MPRALNAPKGPNKSRDLHWIAPENDLRSGKCVTKLRLRMLEKLDPDTDLPIQMKKVGEQTSIFASRLSEYCLGKRPMTARDLFTLATFLRCRPDDITGVEYMELDFIPYHH